MNPSALLRRLLVPGLVLAVGCDVTDPQVPTDAPAARLADVAATFPSPAPEDLVTVAGLEFWPYTTESPDQARSDPINLVFPDVDPRSIRAALMMLDGDRTALGFPPVAPFNCTWKEAMGTNQAAYGTAVGWTGSAIELECGDYSPMRIHLRMFPVGNGTIANTHFEVQITGTNEHEVLSWELPQQLVTADMVRSGVLSGPPTPSGVITQAPTFRAINPLVYNGLPAALKTLIGGPATAGPDGVPLVNDGSASILTFAGPVKGERTVAKREFVLHFDQTIPKPFCTQGPFDYLYVKGPIEFRQQVVVSANGNFISHFHASGGLDLIPVDPATGATGEPMMARVTEHDRSVVTDNVTLVSTFALQLILPGSDPAGGRLRTTLTLGPGSSDHGTFENVVCGR
jgi:hypothetical protein